MKYITIIWLCAIVTFLPFETYAQSNKMNVDGQVLGVKGQPIDGAIISSEEDGISTETDSSGTFSIEVTPEAILSIAVSGYVTKLVVADQNILRVSMTRDADNRLIPVAYRKVEQSDLMGGVSDVNMSEILDKNYITYSLSDMEGLIGGYNGNLWGNDDYLVMVDGVPRDAGSVLPTEIDQISFLKGASAVALYGSRGAKGVILISTKRGLAGENRIDVRANSGVNVPKSYPKFLGSAEYMTLYNEARTNDGLTELYTEEQIYHHGAGANPYRYPNVDYYSDEYLQDIYSRHDATVEISGGNERARYYTNMGFLTEGSVLDFGQAEESRNTRFNVRGNVDMNLNKYITARVNGAASYYFGRGVNTNYWQGASTIRPNRYSPLIPVHFIEESDQASLELIRNSENLIDGKFLLGGTQLDQSNPIADIYAGGSSTFNSRQFQFNTEFDADLGDFIEGLFFKTILGIDYATTYNLSFNNNYAVFQPIWNNFNGASQIGSLTKYGQDASTREQEIGGSFYRQSLAASGVLSYNKVLNANHNISAMLIAGGFKQSQSAQYHGIGNANIGVHLGYNYDNKYYAEFNGSLVHSAKLPEANRQAFSPTMSLAWRISEEGFLANSSVINNLKLNVSAGILNTDMDIDDYYLYESIYRQTDGAWYTWKDGLSNQSTDSRRGANPNMTFPKREEVSIGLEAAMIDNSVVLNGSVFASRMTGLIVQNSVLFPNYFTTGYPNSSFIPFVNYNDDERVGFDFNLNLNQNVGEVDFSLGLTGTYYTTKASKRAENNEYAYQNRQGRPLDAIFGLESAGFFADQADIDGSPEQAFGEVRPGDIKYVDQNGDNTINAQDEVFLGRYGWSGNPLTLGVNLTAKWRSLTFFALGVARTGAHRMMDSDYFWVNGEDKYSEIVRDRWTPETANTASYPRLTTLNGNNNFRRSDFWMYSINRFDLARVQISYTVPRRVIGDGFVRDLGVYVNGSNLLTISPNREILELNINTAPQTRFFNLGVKASF